jgi:hypothetical protein
MRRVRILSGTALTTAGVVWLVERLDGVGAAAVSLARAMPALLLAIGATQLVGRVWHSHLLAPVVLILAGLLGLFLLHGNLSDLAGPPTFLPVVVVLAGLTIALAERNHRESDDANIDQTAFLRTRTVSRTTRPFQVARIRSLLGSTELDLTRCRALELDVEVNITIWLGYVKVIVPDDYQVMVTSSEALGIHVPTLPAGDGSVVTLKISVFGFGGAVDVQRSWTQPSSATPAAEAPESPVESATAPVSA